MVAKVLKRRSKDEDEDNGRRYRKKGSWGELDSNRTIWARAAVPLSGARSAPTHPSGPKGARLAGRRFGGLCGGGRL